MIYISFEFSVPLGRIEPDDYLRHILINVYSFDGNEKKVILGKYAANQLLLFDAQIEGRDVFEICDQDSQGLYEVYEALFKDDEEFHEELAIDEVTFHILFLKASVLHPKLKEWEQAILEAIGNTLGNSIVLAMWHGITDLTDSQLSEMGFAKIAGSNLLFRHMALRTNYRDTNPTGVNVPYDFEASATDEKWVNERWKKVGQTLF